MSLLDTRHFPPYQGAIAALLLRAIAISKFILLLKQFRIIYLYSGIEIMMVRTYVHKTYVLTIYYHGVEIMRPVMNRVIPGELSKCHAFLQYGIPKSSFAERTKNVQYAPEDLEV